MKLDLYIEGKKAVISDQDSVILVSSIQEAKDIGKVFTDFSRQFTLPANKINNQLFNHFYRTDIANGFDTRFKVSAEIKLNGATFRKGKLRLNGVNMKNNKPVSYKSIFFGETIILKDVLNEDKLSSLDFDNYELDYSPTTVKNGLTNGFVFNGNGLSVNNNPSSTGDYIFPLISVDKDYFFSSDDATDAFDGNRINMYKSNNIYDNKHGIKFESLKPAIKVSRIIEKIQERYGLQFSNDFFSPTKISYNDLYLFLHKEKSTLSELLSTISTNVRLGAFTLSSGSEIRENPFLDRLVPNVEQVRYKITPDDNDKTYDITVTNGFGGKVLYARKSLKGVQDIILNKSELRDARELVLTMDSETISSFGITFRGTVGSNIAFYSETSFFPLLKVNVATQMPNIKVIDFLTGIFKLFNLTAYYNEEGLIVIKTLEDYYSDGSEYDITKYVDTSSSQVDRAAIYSELTLGFKEGKTFLTKKRSDLVNEEYGDLVFDSNDVLPYDGTKFKLEVPFEKMLFSRLTDDVTDDLTDMGTGWFVDDNKEPTIGAPLLFYAVKQDASDGVKFDNGVSFDNIDTYIRPSNSVSTGAFTLNFGAEIDEYTLETNYNSLFNKYYQDYIETLYDIRTRKLSYTAYLPYNIMLNYRLNDSLIISGAKYRIEKIESDLKTGKSLLTLISRFEDFLSEPIDVIPPNAPAITFIDKSYNSITINIEDVDVDNDIVEYEVYVDNALFASTPTPFNFILTGLDENTEYDIKVRAIDTSDNIGSFGNELAITTNIEPVDTEAPTAPTVTETDRTASSIEINMSGATDNIGVVSYDIFLNNSFLVNTILTTFNVLDLLISTPYNIKVKARDLAGNSSIASNILFFTLGDSIPPAIPTGLNLSILGSDIVSSWTPNIEPDLFTYKISYQKGTNTPFETFSLSNSNTYTPSSSGTYKVKVKAIDDSENESAYSSEVSIVFP